jgi:predicted dehydrogenase
VEASIGTYPGLSARLEVAGDRGSATIDGDALLYYHVAEEGEETGLYGGGGDTNRLNRLNLGGEADIAQDPAKLMGAHARQIEDFIDAIREDRDPAISLSETVRTMQVIEAIYESAQTGKPVRVGGDAR